MEFDGEEYETDLTTIFEECNKDSVKWFGSEIHSSLPHQVLALCGETGELANLVKKVQRGSLEMDAETRMAMVMEATDCFIYIINVFGVLQYHPAFAYKIKREQNAERFGSAGSAGGNARRDDGGLRIVATDAMDEGR